MSDTPYDNSNSSNPWLINVKKDECIVIKGHALTAEYIWSLQGKARESLVNSVFNHFRETGFPYPKCSQEELQHAWEKIQESDFKNVVNEKGELKNTSSMGLEIIKHYCGEKFYRSKTEKGRSVIDVFINDALLMKVLKNRMGWCLSSEDGQDRPYVFGMTPDMLIQGIRSSGLSKSISQFKVPVAQYIYDKYSPPGGLVLDYSAGWGARLLAAMSLDRRYIGIDPYTAPELKLMLSLGKGARLYKAGSENVEIYKKYCEVDLCFSSPPYFNLEVYSEDLSQCYNHHTSYTSWLINYWKPTVENCYMVLKHGGYFGIAMVDSYNDYDLKKDMTAIIQEAGLKPHASHPMKTSKSHLSSKRETKVIDKINDGILMFRKA